MLDVWIAVGGAVISIIVAFLSGHITAKQEMRALRVDKSVDVYEKLLSNFSKLQANPKLIFNRKYFYECNALKPFVVVYASQAIQDMFCDFCEELRKISEEYQEKFLSAEAIEVRKSIERDLPFADELFEKEEEDYISAVLVDSSMLPASVAERIDDICAEIRDVMKIKGGDKNG